MRRAGLIVIAVMVALPLYHEASFSIYLWSPALESLIRFFYAPFYLLPARFYSSCSSGFFGWCGPDFRALPLVALSFLWMFLFGAAVFWVLQRVPSRYRILTLCFGLAVFLAIGYFTEQAACTRSYVQGVDFFSISNYPGGPITAQTYHDGAWLQGTGLVWFNFNPNESPPSNAAMNWFLKFNGLHLIKGTPTTGILASVPPGQEFAKTCQIETYSQVNTSPISEKDLSGGAYSSYLDPAFCKSNPSYCQLPPALSLYYDVNSPHIVSVTDSSGRRTGADPLTDTYSREIPGSASFQSYEPPPSEVGIDYSTSSPAQYTVSVIGKQNGNYTLQFVLFDERVATKTLSMKLTGTIKTGQVVTYLQNFDPLNTSNDFFTPEISSSSANKD